MKVIQSQAMRVILGVSKSTSAASTGRELDTLPIESRANIHSCLKSSHKPTTLCMMLVAHHIEEDTGQTGYRECTSAMLT